MKHEIFKFKLRISVTGQLFVVQDLGFILVTEPRQKLKRPSNREDPADDYNLYQTLTVRSERPQSKLFHSPYQVDMKVMS